jgi:hypothetical protein
MTAKISENGLGVPVYLRRPISVKALSKIHGAGHFGDAGTAVQDARNALFH